MNIDVVFFERPYTDLKRFGVPISKYLRKINSNLSLGGICLVPPKDVSDLPLDAVYKRSDIHDIDNFLTEHRVKLIVFSNSRVPDLEMIMHAKKLGVKTVMLQEGVSFDGTNINAINLYNIFASFKFFGKVLDYFHILYRMCCYDGRRYIGFIAGLLKNRRDITLYVAKAFSIPLRCDYMLIMGEEWREFYKNSVGYSDRQIIIMGDHDLDGMDAGEKPQEAICYIANVLVEDGTIKKREFLKFVKYLSECIGPETKLYIKLHPRSDKTLYKALEGRNVEFIRQGTLPAATVYIGHRSTLIGRALYISDQLILWRFPSEKVCFYEQYASHVCTSKEELSKALAEVDLRRRENTKKASVEKVYWFNPRGAIRTCAELLSAFLKQGSIKQAEYEVNE